MSKLYSVWYPFPAGNDPPAVEMWLTPANMRNIGSGTDELVAGLLEAAGVSARVVRWSMRRFRTSYFTEYLDSDDWQDVWQPAWKVRAELAEPAFFGKRAPGGEYDANVVDDSWSPDNDTGRILAAPCLVLADFPDPDALGRARKDVAELAPGVRLAEGRALDRFPQLEIDLGDRPASFYEEGAGDAVALAEVCRSLGASTHVHETLRRALGGR